MKCILGTCLVSLLRLADNVYIDLYSKQMVLTAECQVEAANGIIDLDAHIIVFEATSPCEVVGFGYSSTAYDSRFPLGE